ncbi:hypothetical protein ACFOYU_12985 [Microvirga sp. GCM10011540]|uniref:hypothetical protein n=1 Tax=Microvirga sp. GCM10011540 TaxID=3317338 RepID=UPI00361B37F4
MRGGLKSAILLIIGATSAAPALSEVGPFSITNVSDALVRAYNAEDAAAFHEFLAPSLQAKYPVEALRTALVRCRVLTHDIFRLSTPSWGSRRFGFFAVYAETRVFEMVLEIDENEKILHWVITDNVTAKDQQCTVSHVS